MRREHAATGGGRPSEYSPSSSRSTPSPQSIPSLFISWSAIDRRRIDRLWTLLQVQGRRESTEEGLQVRKPEAEGLGGCIRSCEAVPLWSCQEPSRERPSPHYPVDIFHRFWSHHSAQPFSPPCNLVDVLHQDHSVLHRRTLNGQWNLFNSLWLLMLQFIRQIAAWLFIGILFFGSIATATISTNSILFSQDTTTGILRVRKTVNFTCIKQETNLNGIQKPPWPE